MAFNITAIMNVALASGAATKISNDLNRQLSNKKVTIDFNMVNADSIKRIKADIEGAITSVESFGRQAGLAAKRFGAFSLAAGSMIQLTSAIKQATSEAIDFDRQMVKLVQVSGDSGSAIEGVVNEVTRLSTSLGVSSKDLIQAAVTLKQANLSIDDTRIALEALAKAALAPNFENFTNTTEGAIAILNQFKIGANNLESALGAVNAVAGEFAVEAGDIVEAIRKTGGAFKAAGGDLNELLGLFTSVRQTTRESAETISTGLRTIFTRIQRGNTVNALKELGINLRYTREEALALGNANLEQQFVGPYEAIRRLSSALSALPTTDPKFAQVVEELGGYRQISKVIPLIQEFAVSQKAVNVAIAGSASLTTNAGQAQLAYAIKLQKLKEEFNALIRSITQSTGFQKLFDTFISGASAAIQLADALKPLVPLIGALATVKVATGIGQFVKGFSTGITASPNPKIFNQNRFADGGVVRMKRGGVVPGSGSGDIVPALLEPGELVIPKKYAKGGTIDLETYQTSGILTNVIQVALGQRKNSPKLQRKENSSQSFIKGKANYIFSAKDKNGKPIKQEVEIQDSNIPTFIYNPTVKYKNKNVLLSEKIQLEAKKIIKNNENTIKIQSLKDTYGELRGREIAKAILNKSNASQLEGYLFEHEVKNTEKLKDASLTDANFPIDFSGSYNQIKQLPGLEDLVKISNKRNLFVETKRSVVSGNEILDKEVNLFKEQIKNILYKDKQPEEISFKRIKEKNKASGGFIVPGSGNSDSVPMDLDEGSFVIRKSSVAKIGADNLMNMSRKGFAKGGKVPAILTPGEFVFSPSAASSIGGANLDRMNKFGKFALGGRVGLAEGGFGDKRYPIIPEQQNLIFQNKKFNLETLVSAQVGGDRDEQLEKAKKVLTDIIYEQIRMYDVNMSRQSAEAAARGLAESTLKKLAKLDEKILSTKSALVTATASSAYLDPSLDPAVQSSTARLKKLEQEKVNLSSTLQAEALPTGEQIYKFLPAEKVKQSTGGRRGSESIAEILDTRMTERLNKITPDRENQRLLGVQTKTRLLAEEENKFKQQAVLAISEQLRILTGIKDKEILVEVAAQKYAQAIQTNANFTEKNGRLLGLQSLESDIKQAGKKTIENLRGVSQDLSIGKGVYGRFAIGFRNISDSVIRSFQNLRDEIRNAGGGIRGTIAGFRNSGLGRGIIGTGSVLATFGADYLQQSAGTAEDVVSGRKSSTANIIGSGIGSAVSSAATTAILVNAIPGIGTLASAAIIAGTAVFSFYSATQKAAEEIRKLEFQKSAEKINEALQEISISRKFGDRENVALSKALTDFGRLSMDARSEAVYQGLTGAAAEKQVSEKLSEKFASSLQPLTQILLGKTEQFTEKGNFNAEQIFNVLKTESKFFELLGAASRKSGDELNKFAFNLVKGKVEADKLAQVQANAVASIEKLQLSLEFLANAVNVSVQNFENSSKAIINLQDAMDRRSSFAIPSVSEKLKIGTSPDLYNKEINKTFSVLGSVGDESKKNAINLNKLYAALPAALAVAKENAVGPEADVFKNVKEILKAQSIDLEKEFKDFAPNIEETINQSRQSLTRGSKNFDPFSLTKKSLDVYANQINSSAQSLNSAINSVGQEYINGLKRISEQQQRYFNELNVYNQKVLATKRVEAETKAAETGKPISEFLKKEDIIKPFVEQQKGLLPGLVAQNADVLDPQTIFDELETAQAGLKRTSDLLTIGFSDLANEDENARAKARELAEENEDYRIRVANASDALKNLRDDAVLLSEAQNRLAEAEQQREAKLNAARTLLTADRRQIREIEKGRGIAEQVNAGADIMGFSLKARKQFATFIDTFKNVRLPEFGGITGEEIQNRALTRAFPDLNIKQEDDKAKQARADMLEAAKKQEEAAKLYAKAIKNFQNTPVELKKIADAFIKDLRNTFSIESRKPLEAQQAAISAEMTKLAGEDWQGRGMNVQNVQISQELSRVFESLQVSGPNVTAEKMLEIDQKRFESLFKRADVNGGNLLTALNAQTASENILKKGRFEEADINMAGFKDENVIKNLKELRQSLMIKEEGATGREFKKLDTEIFKKVLEDIKTTGNVSKETYEAAGPNAKNALDKLKSSIGLQEFITFDRKQILLRAKEQDIVDRFDNIANSFDKVKDLGVPFGTLSKKFIDLSGSLDKLNEKLSKLTAESSPTPENWRIPQVFPDQKSKGGLVSYFSEGGLAKGKDNIAMIANDEFVVNANATRKNLPLLNAINSGVSYKAEGGMPYGLKRIDPNLYKDFEFKAYLNRITSKDVELKNSTRYGLIDFRDEFEKSISDYLSVNEVFNNKDLLNEYMMELYVRASEKFGNLPSAENINDIFKNLSNSEKNNILKIDSYAPKYPFSSIKVNPNDLNKEAADLWLMNSRRFDRWRAEISDKSRPRNASGYLADIQADNFNNDPNKEAKALIEQTLKYRELFKNKQQQVFNEIITGAATHAKNEIAFQSDPNATRQMPLMDIPLARARENVDRAFQRQPLKSKIQFARKDKNGNFYLDEEARRGNTPSRTGLKLPNIGPIWEKSFNDIGELTAVEVDEKTGKIQEVNRDQFLVPSMAKEQALQEQKKKEIELIKDRRIEFQRWKNQEEEMLSLNRTDEKGNLTHRRLIDVAKNPSIENLDILNVRLHTEIAKVIAKSKNPNVDLNDPRNYFDFFGRDIRQSASIEAYKKQKIESIMPSLGILRKYYDFKQALRFNDPNDQRISFAGRDKLALEMVSETNRLTAALNIKNGIKKFQEDEVRKDGALLPVDKKFVQADLIKFLEKYNNFYSLLDLTSQGKDVSNNSWKTYKLTDGLAAVVEGTNASVLKELKMPFTNIGLIPFTDEKTGFLNENDPEYKRLTEIKDKIFPYYQKAFKLSNDYVNILNNYSKTDYARPYYDAVKKDSLSFMEDVSAEEAKILSVVKKPKPVVVQQQKAEEAKALSIIEKPKPVVAQQQKQDVIFKKPDVAPQKPILQEVKNQVDQPKKIFISPEDDQVLNQVLGKEQNDDIYDIFSKLPEAQLDRIDSIIHERQQEKFNKLHNAQAMLYASLTYRAKNEWEQSAEGRQILDNIDEYKKARQEYLNKDELYTNLKDKNNKNPIPVGENGQYTAEISGWRLSSDKPFDLDGPDEFRQKILNKRQYDLQKSFRETEEAKKYIEMEDKGLSTDIGQKYRKLLSLLQLSNLVSFRAERKFNELTNYKNGLRFDQLVDFKNSGGPIGMVPTMLTPGEAVIPPEIAKSNRGLLESINSGVNYKQDGGSLSLVKSSGESHPLSKGTDTVFRFLEPGSYVVNKTSTEKNMSVLQGLSSGGSVNYLAEGGMAGFDILGEPTKDNKKYIEYLERLKKKANYRREDLYANTEEGYVFRESLQNVYGAPKDPKEFNNWIENLAKSAMSKSSMIEGVPSVDRALADAVLNAISTGTKSKYKDDKPIWQFEEFLTTKVKGLNFQERTQQAYDKKSFEIAAKKQKEFQDQLNTPQFGDRPIQKPLNKDLFQLLNVKKLEEEFKNQEAWENLDQLFRGKAPSQQKMTKEQVLEQLFREWADKQRAEQKIKENKKMEQDALSDLFSGRTPNQQRRMTQQEALQKAFEDWMAKEIKKEKALQEEQEIRKKLGKGFGYAEGGEVKYLAKGGRVRLELQEKKDKIEKLRQGFPQKDNGNIDLNPFQGENRQAAILRLEEMRNLQREVNSENRYNSIVTDLISRPRKSDKNKNEKTKQFEDYIDANTVKVIADEKNRPDKFKDRKDIDKSYFSGITKLNATPIPDNIRKAVVNIAKTKNIKGFSGGNGEFKNVTDFGEIHKLLGNSTVFLRSTDLDTIEDVLSKETKNRYGIATQGSGGDIISGTVKMPKFKAPLLQNPEFISKLTLKQLLELYPNLESSLIDYNNIFDQEQLDELLKKRVNIKPRKFNFGGYVNGAGSGDIIPAYLSAGEFVMNRGAVQEYGYDMLNAMNAKRMYQGGPSDGSPSLFDNVAKSSVNLDSIDTGSFADSVKLFNSGSDKFKQSIDKMGETITRLQSAVNDLAKINIPEEITGNITVENNANVKIDSPNFAGEVNSIVGKAVTNIAKALENTTGGAITQSDLFRDLGTELG